MPYFTTSNSNGGGGYNSSKNTTASGYTSSGFTTTGFSSTRNGYGGGRGRGTWRGGNSPLKRAEPDNKLAEEISAMTPEQRTRKFNPEWADALEKHPPVMITVEQLKNTTPVSQPKPEHNGGPKQIVPKPDERMSVPDEHMRAVDGQNKSTRDFSLKKDDLAMFESVAPQLGSAFSKGDYAAMAKLVFRVVDAFNELGEHFAKLGR